MQMYVFDKNFENPSILDEVRTFVESGYANAVSEWLRDSSRRRRSGHVEPLQLLCVGEGRHSVRLRDSSGHCASRVCL